MTLWYLILLLSFPCFLVCSGLPSNVTIDDAGLVLYFPPGQWTTQESKCSENVCPPAPETSLASNGTWHTNIFQGFDSSKVRPQAEVAFFGSAVYVHCILASTNGLSPYNTFMTFLIDGETVGSSSQSAGTDDINTLVFSNTQLPIGPHTLTIVNGKFDNKAYLMILDDIIYTTDNSTSATTDVSGSSSSSSKSKVLTGVLVSVCLLFGIILAYLLYSRHVNRARRPKALPNTDIELLPTSMRKTAQSSAWGWVAQYLNFGASKRRISFNPSLLVGGRAQLPSESVKGLPCQHSSQKVLAEELDTGSKRSKPEGHWAFISSWRDRAIREAEIPSLPPTSYAPTTIVSGPGPAQPNYHPMELRRPEQQQQETSGAQRPPRRGFTVMNT